MSDASADAVDDEERGDQMKHGGIMTPPQQHVDAAP